MYTLKEELMTYSRERLATFLELNYEKSEYDIIVQDLVFKVLKDEVISLTDQEEFILGIINFFYVV